VGVMTVRYGLTAQQTKLLKFIEEYIAKNGLSPSYAEMKAALNLKSASGIHRIVKDQAA
jgi:repressor LexA